jgi:hypothetical protein
VLVTTVIVNFLTVLVFAGNVIVTVVFAFSCRLVTGGGVIVLVIVVSVGTTIVLVGAIEVIVLETAVLARTVDVQRSGVRFASAFAGAGAGALFWSSGMAMGERRPKKRLPQPACTLPRLMDTREEGVLDAARSDLTRDGVQDARGSERGVTPAQVVVRVVVVRVNVHLVCVME